MDVTPEMRQAVYEADCELLGHSVDTRWAVEFTEQESGVRPRAKDRFPHIFCRRCRKTWIVLPIEGVGYEEAERRVYEHLKPTSELARLITRRLGKRSPR